MGKASARSKKQVPQEAAPAQEASLDTVLFENIRTRANATTAGRMFMPFELTYRDLRKDCASLGDGKIDYEELASVFGFMSHSEYDRWAGKLLVTLNRSLAAYLDDRSGLTEWMHSDTHTRRSASTPLAPVLSLR